MDESTRKSGVAGTATRVAVAGGIAGLGLAVGGIAIATAGNESTSTAPTGPVVAAEAVGGPGDGGFGDGRLGDEFAAQLAEALGVEEADVEHALDEVRDELMPERPQEGEVPSPEQFEAWQSDFAAALAESLDLPVADVEVALADIRADREAQAEERFAELREAMRPTLVEKLDAAIEDGTLTRADKRSVLKAYDAGVIGGGLGFDGPGRFGGPGGFGGGPGSFGETPEDEAAPEAGTTDS